MNNNLLILGAGQYGSVAKEIAESMNRFENISFLDDNSTMAIDKIENFAVYADEYSYAVVAIGNTGKRLACIKMLEKFRFRIPVLVSPRAYISPSARLGSGTIVEPMAIVNANAVVSSGVIVCASAVINHNATVGEGCLLQCGSVVPAGACVPSETKLEYNSVFHI